MVSNEMPAQDRCPGVLRLHDAADGQLARIRLPGGRIDARGLDGLADVGRLGNGLIELTSRASVQVRGLTGAVAGRCAEVLTAAGLLPSPSHERVRNILASPVAGRHAASMAHTDDVVAQLDRGLCADDQLVALSGRFLFAVDDGAGLIGHRADVTLVATGPDSFRLGAREVTRAGAAQAALHAARVLVRTSSAQVAGAPVSQLVHAAGDGASRTRCSVVESGSARSDAGVPARPLELGALRQSDGRIALTVMPPLARLEAATVRALAGLVRAQRTDCRISTRRTLTLVDVEPAAARDLIGELEALGLISDPSSGWVGLTACAGKGACAKARFDVRAAAARRAAQRGASEPAEHYSGCERNCGWPPGARLVASE